MAKVKFLILIIALSATAALANMYDLTGVLFKIHPPIPPTVLTNPPTAPSKARAVVDHRDSNLLMSRRVLLDLCLTRLRDHRHDWPKARDFGSDADSVLMFTKIDRKWDVRDRKIQEECESIMREITALEKKVK